MPEEKPKPKAYVSIACLKDDVDLYLKSNDSNRQAFEMREAITKTALINISRGNHGPTWAKQLLRMYE